MAIKTIPDTLHIYVPLHFYCSLHTDPTITKQTATFIYYAIVIDVPATNMPLKYHM